MGDLVKREDNVRPRGFFEGLSVRLAVALRDERGQGTTEYAILVGVLVVIAILAIMSFRDRVASLWSAIADGINSL